VTLFGLYSCPISSFNASAFDSFGKKQTANSPLCFDCAAVASSVLQFLADSPRHRRVLARDESRGEGKSPLKNQLAVFWLSGPPEAPGGELSFDLEAALAEPMTTSADREGPPPDPSHADALYGLPWRSSATGLEIAKTRFYVAVLSPNKSRLVLRDWIDTSLDTVCHKLKRYDDARTIISADGLTLGRIPVQDMLWALRPWKSRSAGDSANLVRGLIRTAYIGAQPPPELLELAVRRFRVPVRPGRMDETKFEAWRQAQAAAIKLVLTYGTEEAITLQSVKIEGRSAQHLCGQLLAILEEAQMRASRWRINATLVDRFYGGASTSPSTTLGSLLKQATQAHMPKIRKAGFGYEELEQTLESVTEGIDRLGGFPATLTLRQQGEFALGFYLRRAAFRAARPKRELAPAGKIDTDTERSQ
jgi:CRISPR-associated protein Csd1